MESAAPNPVAVAAEAVSDPKVHLSPWQIFWQRLKHRRIAMIGGAILIFLYLVSIFAGFI
jgi:hypothetical protein